MCLMLLFICYEQLIIKNIFIKYVCLVIAIEPLAKRNVKIKYYINCLKVEDFLPFLDISLAFRLRFVVTKMAVISHTRNTQNGPGQLLAPSQHLLNRVYCQSVLKGLGYKNTELCSPRGGFPSRERKDGRKKKICIGKKIQTKKKTTNKLPKPDY